MLLAVFLAVFLDVLLNDAQHRGQANLGALEILGPMQMLKYPER